MSLELLQINGEWLQMTAKFADLQHSLRNHFNSILLPFVGYFYQKTIFNSFCQQCDASVHSLPLKKSHKRNFYNSVVRHQVTELG